MLTEYQKGFLAKIISVPSVGGSPEEGAPYGRKPKDPMMRFIREFALTADAGVPAGDEAGVFPEFVLPLKWCTNI